MTDILMVKLGERILTPRGAGEISGRIVKPGGETRLIVRLEQRDPLTGQAGLWSFDPKQVMVIQASEVARGS